MNEILFLLLILIPCTINISMQEIPIGSSNPTSLPAPANYKYFYSKIPTVSYSKLYFYLTETSNGLSNPSCCVTQKDPYIDSTVGTCTFIDLYLYNSKTSDKKKEYFYQVEISRNHPFVQNVIVKYSTTGSSLNVRISYEDIYKSLNKTLSTGAIIGIVIGCVMILMIASFFIRVYYKKKIMARNSAYMPPQHTMDYSNPSYPAESSNNNYPANY